MTNIFLKVNKDLFNLGLAPVEILILAQVMEYDNNTGKCFISDNTLAAAFGVSAKTISRAVSNLESKGFIKRETKNIKGGRERVMLPNIAAIEKALTTDKMSIVEDKQQNAQQSFCPLTTDKMSLDNGQNDFIKDNIKDNSKDNIGEVFQPQVAKSTSLQTPKEEVVAGQITVHQLERMGVKYTRIEQDKAVIDETGKVFKLIGF